MLKCCHVATTQKRVARNRKPLYSLRHARSNFKGITMALLQLPRLLISVVRNAIVLCNN